MEKSYTIKELMERFGKSLSSIMLTVFKNILKSFERKEDKHMNSFIWTAIVILALSMLYIAYNSNLFCFLGKCVLVVH
jgi:hypothetical protein